MKKNIFAIICFYFFVGYCYGQTNPPTIAISAPPVPNGFDTYTVASTKINLLPTATGGFRYGFITATNPPTTNLLNLRISSYNLNPNFNNTNAIIANNYFDPSVAPFQGFNKNLEFGITDGAYAVSPNGEFTYNIPIIGSPGTAGIEPSISINYNSQGYNGLIGAGWNLSGVSMIERTGKNVFDNGNTTPVTLTNADNFTLDGKTLIPISGNNGANGTTYSLEEHDFSVIKSASTAGNGPDFFYITRKDGTIIEYGNTASTNPSSNSKLFGVGDVTAFAWYINKITDVFGNFMTYNYTNTNGEILLQSINYTGNIPSGIAPYNSIKFEYMDKGDPNKNFMGGKLFNNDKLLKTITCFDSNNQQIKKFNFIYQFDVYSLLYQIIETDKNGNQLNPTVFYWGEQNGYRPNDVLGTPCHIPTTGNVSYSDVRNVKAADIDGDGYSDLVYFSDTFVPQTSQAPSQTVTKLTPFYNDWGDEAGLTQFGTDFYFYNTNQVNTISTTGADDLCLGMFSFDEDDDNSEEVAAITSCTNDPGSAPFYVNQVFCNFHYKVSKFKNSSGMSTDYSGTQATPIDFTHFNNDNFCNPNALPCPFLYDVNDYTGDGVKDKLITDQEKLVIISGSNSQTYSYNYPHQRLSVVRPGDFNSDGKLDLFVIAKTAISSANPNNYEVKVLSFNQVTLQFDLLDTKTIDLPTNDPAWGGSGKANNFINAIDVGDVNADGKTDIVYLYHGNFTNIHIVPSNGLTFDTEAKFRLIDPVSYANDLSLSLRDINYDGKADLVIQNSWGKNASTNIYNTQITPTYSIFTSSGLAFEFTPYTNSIDPNSFYDFGDFNGDGNNDMVNVKAGNEILRLTAYNKKHNTFLTKIKNAKEDIDIQYTYVKSEVDYNSRHRVYEKILSVSGYKPSAFVVNYVKNKNIIFRYSYGNGFFATNRGFLGFGTHKAINVNDLIGTTCYITPSISHRAVDNSAVSAGKMMVLTDNSLTNVFGYYLNSNAIASSYTLTNNYMQLSTFASLPGLQIIFNPTVTKDTRDYLKSVFCSEVDSYDQNTVGNMSSLQKIYGTSSSTLKGEQTFFYYSLVNGLYKLTKKNLNFFTYGTSGTTYLRQTDYTYDNQWHLQTIVNDQPLGTQALTTTFSNFNLFGSPLQISKSGSDIQTRTDYFVYDPTGRFVTKKTNTINDFEQYIFEPSFGKITQSTDISGLTTQYTYDGQGRLTKIQKPNNAVDLKSYQWNQNASTFDGSYVTTVANEGAAKLVSLYNGFDMLLKLTSDGFNGTDIVSNFSYDLNNRLIQDEEPHFTNQAAYKTSTYQYEQTFFRTSKNFLYTNNASNYIPEGIIEYVYSSPSTDNNYFKGSMLIKYPSGNNFMQEYNVAGQIDKVYNYPSLSSLAQVSDYTLHANGQPMEIKNTFQDGLNSKTSITYDGRGSKASIIDQSSGTTSYQYNCAGEVKKQITSNGTFDFYYDNIGRMDYKTGSLSGTTTYQYVTAAAGREQVLKATGPSAISDFMYDNLNRLIEDKQTIGTTVMKTDYIYDKYGNVTDYTYPNNFALKKEYDAIGTLLRIKNGNTVIWECNSFVTAKQIGQYTYGNGIVTNINLDNNLHIKEVDHGNLYKLEYTIDPLNQNLTDRKFSNLLPTTSVSEEQFSFDGEQRLAGVNSVINNAITPTQALTYSDNGNIQTKSDAGTYVYGNTNQPYTLTNINNPTNNISTNLLTATYNDFKRVTQITEANTNKKFDFFYGNDQNRIQMNYSIGSTPVYTRYYANNYDRQETGSTYKEWDYIYAPTGLAAIYYNNNGSGQLLYTLTDNIGSPVLITDASSSPQILEKYNFDAWGRRRDPNNWNSYTITQPQYLIRGFTMHEMLDEINMINMNARLYDPVVGRFLQTDNFVENPSDLQTYNRYSYCRNNPLKYTDPTGNDFGLDDAVAMIIGGASNVKANWDHIDENGKFSGINWGHLTEYFAAGAVSSEVGLITDNPALGFIVGGALNVSIDALNGNFDKEDNYNIIQSFLRGGLSALEGSSAGREVGEFEPAGISEDEAHFNVMGFDDDMKYAKAIYAGIVGIADGYADNRYSDSKSIAGDVIANFVSGAVSSFISDKMQDNLYNGWEESMSVAGFVVTKLIIYQVSASVGEAAKTAISLGFEGHSTLSNIGTQAAKSADSFNAADSDPLLITLLSIIKAMPK